MAATAAPAVSSAHRPARNSHRSMPELSASTPPAAAAWTGTANGPQAAKPATVAQKTTKATGIQTTNHSPCCAATTSPMRRLPAPTAGAVRANISGSS